MKKAFVIGSLLVVLTLSLGGSVASKGTDNGATYEQLRLFTEVLSIVQNQYVDEVPPKELIYSAIKGTLRGLDPHSSFLDPTPTRRCRSRRLARSAVSASRSPEGRHPHRRVAHRRHAGVPRRLAHGRPHCEDRRARDQGHAAAGRRQAHARPAGTKVTVTIVREGDGAEGLRHHARADPRALGALPGSRQRHRVHQAASVPGQSRTTSSRRSRSSTRAG